jgi:hypothetical protein
MNGVTPAPHTPRGIVPASLTPTRPHGADDPADPTDIEVRNSPPPVRPLRWLVGALLMTIVAAAVLSAAMVLAASTDPAQTTVRPADDGTETAPALPDEAGVNSAAIPPAGDPADVAPPSAGQLTIDEPAVGAVFRSGDVIRGTSTSDTVAFRLSAAGIEFVTGTIPVVDGSFDAELEFTNTCCIEMSLRVSHPDNSSAVVIPLAYPEPS